MKKSIKVTPFLGVSGRQINRYLKKNDKFKGCFSSNNIPYFKKFPFSLIINTSTSNEAGDHWVSVYISKKYCLFFDSFGVPVIEKNILNYFSNYNIKTITYSNVCIQAIESFSCGLFCIGFIKNVRNLKTFYDYVNKFNSVNLSLNDNIIYNNI